MRKVSLIKVVGTIVYSDDSGKLKSQTGRGIVKLKRGQTPIDFIQKFLVDRGVVHCTLNQRSENSWSTTPIMFLVEEPKLVISYVFTQFDVSEIGYYAKDLTKQELLRDFKFLKKVIDA